MPPIIQRDDGTGATLVLGACCVVGLVYSGIVTRRARRTTAYKPVIEDWIWHVVLPFVAYATLLSAAATLVRYTTAAMFAIGAVSLLLLFVGFHNAWDTVTYIAVEQQETPEDAG